MLLTEVLRGKEAVKEESWYQQEVQEDTTDIVKNNKNMENTQKLR